MVIEQIAREGVLKASRESLGLSPSAAPMDDPLLTAMLRRAAAIHCPCSPLTIINSVLDALQYLVEDDSSIEERLADLTDKLIVTGDLLELNQVTTDDPDVKGTWLFAVPPSFVARPDGTIFLLGLATDEVTRCPPPLPRTLCMKESCAYLSRKHLRTRLQSCVTSAGWSFRRQPGLRPLGAKLPHRCAISCCASWRSNRPAVPSPI
jgi:hypothetical protein